MALEVKVPPVGESVQEGVIFKWHKQSGDFVDMDEVIVELETDKATVEVVAEKAGELKTLKKEGDTVNVGEVIAEIDTSKQGASKKPAASLSNQEKQPESSESQPIKSSFPAATSHAHEQNLSPAVQRMVSEHSLNPGQIEATGKGGRLTKGDVIRHMDQGQPSASEKSSPSLHVVSKSASALNMSHERSERRETMSMLRRRIAERMVQAQQTAAILTTFNEIDMSSIMSLRKQYKEAFKERHGVSLGFMGFFVKATVEALKDCPAINGWIDGNEIVYHNYQDIGVAVSSPRGLVVPVVRDCDRLSLAEVESAIGAYAIKARDGKLTVDEMQGGTFTISNGGVFGSLMSTPILNPPQSGILGMHAIKERAVVVAGQIVVRPMMYVALSYDHRVVDGKEAVTFLVKIKDLIEDPTRLVLGV